MGKVATGLSMSLDGFVAGPNDGPGSPLGDGGERLFAWYSGGDTDRIQAAWYRDGVRGLVAQRRAPSGGARQNGRVRDGTQDVRHRQRLGWQPPLRRTDLRRQPCDPASIGVRGLAVYVRHGRRRERRLASKNGRGRQGRRRGRRQHRAAVHQGGAPRRDTPRPGARPAGGRRPIVRASGHGADRAGEHPGDRGRWGHASRIPRREVICQPDRTPTQNLASQGQSSRVRLPSPLPFFLVTNRLPWSVVRCDWSQSWVSNPSRRSETHRGTVP
jgi:hypothetical protein